MSYEPLHHKYRPATFADLVGQEAIAATLTSAIRQQKIAPAYLFAGPRGTGKTSSARILAKSLNCLEWDVPTEKPCGTCEACRSIANSMALDTIEIDAASNTGVDNIRDLIERAQFAPVQCRYKLYIIDECLTGDSLVLTDEGLMRIDNPNLRGKKVLSYNDSSRKWEYKKVLRWLDRGKKSTVRIKTNTTEIRCTSNHWIRSDRGWIQAKDLETGMRILSPVLADVERLSQSTEQIKEAPVFNFIPKGIPEKKIRSLPTGLLNWDIQQSFDRIVKLAAIKFTTTLDWTPKQLDNGCRISDSIPHPEWNTNLEIVESIRESDPAEVYDLEVEDNHNFVANGLLVHNCHMLSTAAFNALLKTLEEPPDRVVFVLATTDPQRVLPTIISRCQRFDFRRIPIAAMVAHLQDIARKEAIAIDDEAIALVAQIAQGGLRDAQSLLDQLGLLDDRVTIERVWDLVGAVPERDLMALLEAIADDNPNTVLERVRHLMDRGREPPIVLQNLAGFYRDLLIAKTAPDRRDLVAVTPDTWERLCQFAQRWSVELILAGGQHLRGCEGQIKSTTQPRLWLEVALLGLLPSALQPPSASLPLGYAPPSNVPPASSPPPPRSFPEPPPNPPIDRPEAPRHEEETERGGHGDTGKPGNLPTASPTPNPPPTPNLENGAFSSTEVWGAVLELIPKRATRELLRQQGQLSYFDRSIAKISLSPGLIKVASSKLEEIKQAFFQVCQGPIEVRLESNTANSAPTAPVPVAPNSGNGQYSTGVAARSQPAPTPPPTAPVTTPVPATATHQNGASPSPVAAPTTSQPDTTLPPPPTAIWDEDEVDIAAKHLAEYFSGEVIANLEDSDLEPGGETEEN